MLFRDGSSFELAADFRWWYLPSWLSLDAPCVAVTWAWAASRAMHSPLPIRVAAALFFVVWCIYLSDRLIDVARCPDWTKATGRLRFGRRWQPIFWVCLVGSTLAILGIVRAGLPKEVLRRGAVVALGVGLHYVAFIFPVFSREKLRGKEFGVGLFFALGVYACIGANLQAAPLFFAFAVLVTFNCLVIASRDKESDQAIDRRAASGWWRTMHRDLAWIGTGCTLAAGACAMLANETSFYLAITVAFATLTILHTNSGRYSGDAVCARSRTSRCSSPSRLWQGLNDRTGCSVLRREVYYAHQRRATLHAKTAAKTAILSPPISWHAHALRAPGRDYRRAGPKVHGERRYRGIPVSASCVRLF